MDCGVLEAIYDVLSEVLPKLNKNTPKRHNIQRPTYSDTDNDNIYSYVNKYNTLLAFESLLENNSRTYTPFELAVYIADDLERDPHKRFEKGISHVKLQLKHSSNGITVPKDISITKIAKTICKYSPEYVNGEYNETNIPVIHAIQKPFKPTSPAQNKKPASDTS